MKIAVSGGSISGMLTAYLLCEEHGVTCMKPKTISAAIATPSRQP
jgi:predicted NAD/FAD-binding protein